MISKYYYKKSGFPASGLYKVYKKRKYWFDKKITVVVGARCARILIHNLEIIDKARSRQL